MTINNILYTLHTLAFITQVGGGFLVVGEARRTFNNIKELKDNLDLAELTKDEHRQHLTTAAKGTSVPGLGGGRIQIPGPNPAIHEHLVEQLGPGAADERRALRDFLTLQFSEKRSGTIWGIALVLGGSILGLSANILSVNPPTW